VTCIAGIAENGVVWLAGDSAGVGGWDLTVRADPKVFVNGPYVMGFTTSFRMGQLLEHALTPPAPDPAGLHAFMCTTFVDAVRACLKDGGWASKDKEQEEGGTFLVGVSGRLFRVCDNYQVGEAAGHYDAIGCGGQAACGALFATAGMDPMRRLGKAMEAAEHLSAGVRGPFMIARTPAGEGAAETPPEHKGPPSADWTQDVTAEWLHGTSPASHVILTHRPTGITGEGQGVLGSAAMTAATRDLGEKLVAKCHITVNDARRALGLEPWPVDAAADPGPVETGPAS
jgi:hypothetical protein